MDELEAILKNKGLRKTSFRKELLKLFYTASHSLTVEEIRTTVGSTIDKVTVYRAVESFEENGLIHKVPDKHNLTRYALCNTQCNSHEHIHNHAHFICNGCDKTFCVNGIETPKIKDTKGFEITKSKLTLEGYCPNCIS